MESPKEELALINRKGLLIGTWKILRSKRHETNAIPPEDLITEADLGWEVYTIDERLMDYFDANAGRYYQEQLDARLAEMTEKIRVLALENEAEKANMVTKFEVEKAELMKTYCPGETKRQEEMGEAELTVPADSPPNIPGEKKESEMDFLAHLVSLAQKLRVLAIELQVRTKKPVERGEDLAKQDVVADDASEEFCSNHSLRGSIFGDIRTSTGSKTLYQASEDSLLTDVDWNDTVPQKVDETVSLVSEDSLTMDVAKDNTVTWIVENPDPNMDFSKTADIMTNLLS